MPAWAQNDSVGPFTARPPTNGLTATTGPLAAASASRIPGTDRIGPIEMTGFDGPTTITSAPAIASRTAVGGRAASMPRSSTPSTGPAAPWTIMNSWNGSQSPADFTQV